MNHTALFRAAVLILWQFTTGACPGSGNAFNIRDYGAIGDGKTLDTVAINKAVDECSAGGGGQVRFPPGRYLSGTIHLKNGVGLFLESGATLVGTTNLSQYQQPTLPSDMPEARWGKWHRALILGESAENVSIGGLGTIDGNKVFDPTGEERMRGPHTIVFVNCRKWSIRDLSIVDSANYAIFFQVSDEVEVRNVKFVGGWDGVHFRGSPKRNCHDVQIIGCQFYTGDDSIAGRYWDRVLISDCVVNSSCNGIRLIGPAQRLIVNDCLFYGPGAQPHRSSNRYNMLSGIVLQPGAWDATQGVLDDVLISDVTMHNVASPVNLWIKKGNTAGQIRIQDLKASGVYRSALSVESFAETPITNVVFRDITVEYTGGGKAEQARQTVKGPGVDARSLPSYGIYARNVHNLTLENAHFTTVLPDQRPVLMADGVQRLKLDGFRYPQESGAFFQLTNVVEKVYRDVQPTP